MTNQNIALCRLFIQNRDIVKEAYPWESAYLYPVCASIFTDKGLTADRETLLSCKQMLKESVSCFSNFRGTGRLPILCTLAADPDPKIRLAKALKAHEALREHFSGSQFLPLAAVILSGMTDEYRFSDISARAKQLYKMMREKHPWLTSREDEVFAVLLALSYKSDTQLLFEMETCYKILKQHFSSSNAVQSLTHVLTLSEGRAEKKCKRIIDLWNELKTRGHRYSPIYTLPTLGVVSLLNEGIPSLYDQLLEADNFLKTQKGYGFWGLDKNHRIIHAGMLVTAVHEGAIGTAHAAAINSALASITAQQAAMCAVIAASSAASASASN